MGEIFVTGHRNPDTDAIVAAISYAALRNALGDREYKAARIGSINDETARMLERFGFEPPQFIKNMRTQVYDLDYDRPPALTGTVTMDLAWRTMRNVETSTLPIVDEEGKLCGLLSAGDIASYDMQTISESRIDALPVFNLLSVLEGQLVNENSFVVETVSGEVRIAVPQAIDDPADDGQDCILICGDQPEVIEKALEREINCLIICNRNIFYSLLYNIVLLAGVIEIYFLCYYKIDPEITGIAANVFNVLMYAAPGEKMYTVCKTGNYELIPIWSTIGAIACSTSWMLYGFYQGDILLVIPNALGDISALVQIFVYFYIKGKTKRNNNENENGIES